MQLIVIRELSKAENLWLCSLTDEIADEQEAENLVREYQKHKRNKLYESVMNIIVRANEKQFEEVRNMCEALIELMSDYIEEQVSKQVNERVNKEVNERVKERTGVLKQEGSDDKAKIIVKNMLLRGMSDEDIMALAECDQDMIDHVRMQLS